MNVAIDGIIYELSGLGGIVRTYDEILPCMCDMDANLWLNMITDRSTRVALPSHARITLETISPVASWLRPKRIWRQVPFHVRRRLLEQISLSENTVWHSTYYTQLPRSSAARIVSVYDMIHEKLPEFFNSMGASAFREQKRHAIQEADCLLCISKTTQQDLRDVYGVNIENTRVTPLAASPIFRPLTAASSLAPSHREKPFFLYVGRRDGYKNFDGLAKDYVSWHQRNEVDLVVVGPAWSSRQEALLDDLGIRDNVRLQVNTDDSTLCRLYNEAVAFIYPSLYEGFGIPLLEAMACGCPVIASNIPSSREVAQEIAIYFEPTDAETLHAALDTALSSCTRGKLASAGIDRASQFSWRLTAEMTLKVYREFQSYD